jgi:hypothetical protein
MFRAIQKEGGLFVDQDEDRETCGKHTLFINIQASKIDSILLWASLEFVVKYFRLV